jgi:epoxyqueuosine reductase
LLRNVCVALGNIGDPIAVPALTAALNDKESLVRGHAAWALGRIGGKEARTALAMAQVADTDVAVREEARYALALCDEQDTLSTQGSDTGTAPA